MTVVHQLFVVQKGILEPVEAVNNPYFNFLNLTEINLFLVCATYRESLYTKTERFTNILPAEDQSKRCVKLVDSAVSFGVAAMPREFPFMVN